MEKMPTGLADPGEDIHEAAIRELKEETNLTATFCGIVAFRQAHGSNRNNRYISNSKKPATLDSASTTTAETAATTATAVLDKQGKRINVSRTSSDLFFVCHLELVLPQGKKDTDDADENDVDSETMVVSFQADADEIAAIQWMSVADYCAQERWQSSPTYLELNQAITDHAEQLVQVHQQPIQQQQQQQQKHVQQHNRSSSTHTNDSGSKDDDNNNDHDDSNRIVINDNGNTNRNAWTESAAWPAYTLPLGFGQTDTNTVYKRRSSSSPSTGTTTTAAGSSSGSRL